MVERLLFHTLKNLPRRDSFLKHSMESDYLPEFKSNQNHNTFMMQLCESGQRKEIKLTDTSCRVMFSRQLEASSVQRSLGLCSLGFF